MFQRPLSRKSFHGIRITVRHCVRDWKAFHGAKVMDMAAEAGIPEADRRDVVDYIAREIAGLHEGNVIRYRLSPEDLAGLTRTEV